MKLLVIKNRSAASELFKLQFSLLLNETVVKCKALNEKKNYWVKQWQISL